MAIFLIFKKKKWKIKKNPKKCFVGHFWKERKITRKGRKKKKKVKIIAPLNAQYYSS